MTLINCIIKVKKTVYTTMKTTACRLGLLGLPLSRSRKNSSDLHESQDQVWRRLGVAAVPICAPRGDANACS